MCLLAGCKHKAGLGWELEVVRYLLAISEVQVHLSWELEVVRYELVDSELAGGELVGLLPGDIFLHNARLGEVLYWDQPV